MADGFVGRSVPRREGHDKVTGATSYVDDVVLPGMWHGVTVRSNVARAKLLGIEFGAGIPWHEFAIVTAADLPGPNVVKLIDVDQPLLAHGEIHHADEPVVLLAHPDRAMAERGRAAVTLRLEPLPAVFDLDAALRGDVIVWGKDNLFREYLTGHGDVDAALADPDLVVVEGTYETGAQEQMYIEPQGMIAEYDDATGVCVQGSLQCPYYVHAALVALFELPPEKIRVIQTATGGGFGGKEEYPSVIAAHAAVLARKAGRPVKLIYDRVEDVRATTKRHPSRTRHRTAVRRDGTLVAMDIDFVIDGGAYLTLSPVVLSRAVLHLTGPYRCEHVRVRARAVATSHPPHGAFRGFGAPQSVFALERQLDRVADALGMDPAALRRKNLLRQGERTAVGQLIDEPIALEAVLDRALASSRWHERRAAHEAFNRSTDGPLRRGIGLATFMHGAGFTGAGEVHLASVAHLEAHVDGTLEVLAASTEIGQGTTTIFAQIVADAIGLPMDRVRVARPDTAAVPNSGPTVASRTTMVVGNLLRRAALEIRAKLVAGGGLPAGDGALDPAAFTRAVAAFVERHGRLRGEARYQPPEGLAWDEKAFRGDAYAAYAWAAYVADVTVDLRTAEVRIEDFVAVQEVGRVVNPVLAAGQIEGGVAQAIGWAIYERVVWKDGRVANPQMTNYIIPTSVDTPPIRVEFMAPFLGDDAPSKGIGELPMDGPAPAILAAIAHASGADVTAIPLLPEQLMLALPGGQA
ncbi:MAG: xanthine dehydrogenase family protein [Deltaproteobacteria bacterium]|nr:xanthine dehydrogenase family protein [Deltaproteobacteria bacterium]